LRNNCAFVGHSTKYKIHYYKTSIRTDYTLTLLLADSNTGSSIDDAQTASRSGTAQWEHRHQATG